MAGVLDTIQIRDADGDATTFRVWDESGVGTGPFSFVQFITDISHGEYETVAASQTNQALGASGATGDYLGTVWIVPATTSPGSVVVKDGSTSPDVGITVFTGGASSVSNLVPFPVALGIRSTSGGWSVTTGANVSVIATGNFT